MNSKTRLAVEYCHEIRLKSPETWVFWVHASNSARYQKSLHDLADRAKIPGRENPNVNIFQLFGNWLQDSGLGSWLLVLDNVDSDELLKSPEGPNGEPTPPPIRYLLANPCGTILVTSRNESVSLDIAGPRNTIELHQMGRSDALRLFEAKLGTCTENEDAIQLLEELEFMPLAIVQAAAYITHRLPRFSIRQYLDVIQQNDHKAMQLLEHEEDLLDRDWEAKSSILLTLQISFDHISVTNPSASDLLSLMSFFDPQGIPESVLRVHPAEGMEPAQVTSRKRDAYWLKISHKLKRRIFRRNNSQDYDPPGSVTQEPVNQEQFEDDIKTLREYSMITINETNGVFSMHRLVCLAARAWLKAHNQEEIWQGKFIYRLWLEFPRDVDDISCWDKCRSLFPHAKRALSLLPKSDDDILRWGRVLCSSAYFADHVGNYYDALEMASRGKVYLTNTIGANEEVTLDLSSALASAYFSLKRLDEALELDLNELEVRRNIYKDDSPGTQITRMKAATTLITLERYQEAKDLLVKVRDYFIREEGEEADITFRAELELGQIAYAQGRIKEAEARCSKVLASGNADHSGRGHFVRLWALKDLAFIRKHQGRNAEALTLLRECKAEWLRLLGPHHKYVLMSSEYISQWENEDSGTTK